MADRVTARPPKGLSSPGPATLAKYGLTLAEWLVILRRQGWVCAVCRRFPKTGRFNTDHDHVRGWKKMPPEERKRHVRGVLCHFCNHYYVARCITVERAENVAEYLRQHAARVGQQPIRGLR